MTIQINSNILNSSTYHRNSNDTTLNALERKAEINFCMQKTLIYSNTFKYSNIRNLSPYQDSSNDTPFNALGRIVEIISRNKTKL